MSSMENSYPWYAVRVRPRWERTVSAALSGKGYEEYLPVYRERRRWSDRQKDLDLPLFPGYLFCRFDVQARLPILMTPGVISIVGTGKVPAAISESEVGAIQTMVSSGLLLEPWPHLPVGTSVVIERGPLKGLEGVTMDIRKKFRFVVSVSMLQRSVAVEIDSDWIRPTSPVAVRPVSLAPAATLSSVARFA